MTPSDDPHLDDAAISAHLDGEADHRLHLESCPPCHHRLAELRAVAGAVGAAPPLPSGEVRDRMVALALAAADDGGRDRSAPRADEEAAGGARVVSLASRRDRVPRWLAAAAVVAVLAAAVPVIVARSADDTPTAARDLPTGARDGAEAQDETAAADSSAAAAGGAVAGATLAAPGPISDGDLGPQSQVADLERLARARLDTPSGGDDTGPDVVAHCETDARMALAVTGPLAYVATLQWRGTDAEVLVFREPDGRRPLAVMARPGCRLLDRGQT